MPWALSSGGESAPLIRVRSVVRVHEGPPGLSRGFAFGSSREGPNLLTDANAGDSVMTDQVLIGLAGLALSILAYFAGVRVAAMWKKRRAKPAPRRKRSIAELQAIWEHVTYEIQMFGETGRFLSAFKANPSNDTDRVTQNAFIESFAIHARALMAFLYPKDPYPDDVIADDFFSDPSPWHRKRPPMTAPLTLIHRRVGKEIAHLTYARPGVMPEEKAWPFVRIEIDMNLVLREFVVLLPQDFVKPNVSQSPTGQAFPPGATTLAGPAAETTFVTKVGSEGLGQRRP